MLELERSWEVILNLIVEGLPNEVVPWAQLVVTELRGNGRPLDSQPWLFPVGQVASIYFPNFFHIDHTSSATVQMGKMVRMSQLLFKKMCKYYGHSRCNRVIVNSVGSTEMC